MKRLIPIALLAAAMGCVPNQADSAVRLLAVRPVGGTATQCGVSNTSVRFQGAYDVSSAAGAYLLGLEVESALERPNLNLGDRELATPNINDAILTQAEYSYTVTPTLGSGTPPPQASAFYAVVPAAATRQNSNLILSVITPDMANRLQSVPIDSLATEVHTLFVGIQLKGQLGSGQPIVTNKITFPIRLFNSGACPSDTRQGICGYPPGQDDTAPCRAP